MDWTDWPMYYHYSDELKEQLCHDRRRILKQQPSKGSWDEVKGITGRYFFLSRN